MYTGTCMRTWGLTWFLENKKIHELKKKFRLPRFLLVAKTVTVSSVTKRCCKPNHEKYFHFVTNFGIGMNCDNLIN